MAFKLRTLRKRADFLRARSGRYHVAPGLILQVSRVSASSPSSISDHSNAPDDQPEVAGNGPRFGFTATKKLGNAVQRNRVKRRLREAVRRIAPQFAQNGFEYVLIGRQGTLKRPFQSLLVDLTTAFQRVHGRQKHRPRSKGRQGAPRQRSASSKPTGGSSTRKD